jgi:hypothetical protein
VSLSAREFQKYNYIFTEGKMRSQAEFQHHLLYVIYKTELLVAVISSYTAAEGVGSDKLKE